MSTSVKSVKNNESGPHAQSDKEWFPGYPGYIAKEKIKLWNMESGLPLCV